MEPEIFIQKVEAELLDTRTCEKLGLLANKYEIDFIVLYPDMKLSGSMTWRGEPDLMSIKKHILELYKNCTIA